MLYAILCYNDEDVVCSWTKEEDDAVMARLDVVQEKLAKARQARAGRPAAADHRRDHAAQGPRAAAGDRRAVRRDQGAAARLLRRRLCRRSRRRSRSRASLAAANPGRRLRDPAGPPVPAGERRDVTDLGLDRRGADGRAPAGGRRAAALFPRPRHRRGGLPGRLPAGAEELAAERSAARSRRLADHGRPQRRDRRGAAPRASRRRCRPRRCISDLDDAEAELAERLDGAHYRDDILRLLFICCHPDLPATQQIALALRIVSGLSVKQIARAFLVSESAMEQRITRAKAASPRPTSRSRRRARSSAPSGSPPWRP